MTPGQQAAWVRDVPVSCMCDWHWIPQLACWVRDQPRPGCVWHSL